MGQFVFRVTGASQTQSKKLRKAAQSSFTSSSAVRAVGQIGLAGIIAYGILLAIPRLVGLAWVFGVPVVEFDGGSIVGKSVLVVRDTSGSMNIHTEKLDRQIARLKQSGVAVTIRDAQGMGVSRAGGDNNLLNPMEAALKGSYIDTVYAFSDFDDFDADIWKSDADGYARLRVLLARHDARLYVGTVSDQKPPAELLQIALESGGGLIR